ncbi:hypothetical protein EDD15DRAFT_2302322 [Pisolithus albus]|nr:hypothetical protein EDD15DRAFT_2302322 [Pisolithus albus]
MTIMPVKGMPHTECLLHDYESSRKYDVQDFLRISRRVQADAVIIACDLYDIPCWDAWYHEFLLVHINISGQRLMLVLERNPSNEDVWVLISGGVAKDTVTVIRACEDHEYWSRFSRTPVCKGTLLWHHPLPHLSDIGFLASAATITSKYYNFYIRQCFWYARVILAAMGRLFPHSSMEGTTLFLKKRFAIFGSYKASHVELLVDLHKDYCRDLPSLTSCLPPVAPAVQTKRLWLPHLTASDILRGLTMCLVFDPLVHTTMAACILIPLSLVLPCRPSTRVWSFHSSERVTQWIKHLYPRSAAPRSCSPTISRVYTLALPCRQIRHLRNTGTQLE